MTQSIVADEKGLLLAYLDNQRRHVLSILDGLSDADMHRAALPSGWTPAGLVNHLAIDVERFWFRAVVAGEESVIDRVGTDPEAWKVTPETPVTDIAALYKDESERSNAVITATSLDAPPAWWPAFFPNYRLHNMRDVILHVITETACHAGHADAARELIDGKLWRVLTG